MEDLGDPEYEQEQNVDTNNSEEYAFFRLTELINIGDENQGNASVEDGDGSDYDDSNDLICFPSDGEEEGSCN